MTTAVQNGHGPSATPTVDPSESPLHRLTPEQIEAIGKEFEELTSRSRPTSATATPRTSAR